MEYTTRLPATHLGGEALTALEEALTAGCTSPDLEIVLDYGAVTYRHSSLEEIRRDVTLPDVVRSFEVDLSAREGQAELVADRQEFVMRLSGDSEWVESKRRSIESFFETHGATARTFLERYLAFCLGFAALSLGLVLYYSGYGAAIGMNSPVDSLLFTSLALMTGGVLHLALNRVYPYAVLVPARSASAYLTYLRQ
jgi:hypothetical protein